MNKNLLDSDMILSEVDTNDRLYCSSNIFIRDENNIIISFSCNNNSYDNLCSKCWSRGLTRKDNAISNNNMTSYSITFISFMNHVDNLINQLPLVNNDGNITGVLHRINDDILFIPRICGSGSKFFLVDSRVVEDLQNYIYENEKYKDQDDEYKDQDDEYKDQDDESKDQDDESKDQDDESKDQDEETTITIDEKIKKIKE